MLTLEKQHVNTSTLMDTTKNTTKDTTILESGGNYETNHNK